MRQKLNLITLGVKDFERSINFYEKGLGWKPAKAGSDTLAVFLLGGIALALYPHDELARDADVSPEGKGFSGITLSYNAKTEQEVDEVFAEVEKLGAKIIKPAQTACWGGYSGYFADPDGHLIEVAFNPFWELDENDNIKLSVED